MHESGFSLTSSILILSQSLIPVMAEESVFSTNIRTPTRHPKFGLKCDLEVLLENYDGTFLCSFKEAYECGEVESVIILSSLL